MARFAGWRGLIWGFVIVSVLAVSVIALGADRSDPIIGNAFSLAMAAAVLMFPVNFFLPLKLANVIGSVLITMLDLVAWVLVTFAVPEIRLIVIGAAALCAGFWGYRQWYRRVSTNR